MISLSEVEKQRYYLRNCGLQSWKIDRSKINNNNKNETISHRDRNGFQSHFWMSFLAHQLFRCIAFAKPSKSRLFLENIFKNWQNAKICSLHELNRVSIIKMYIYLSIYQFIIFLSWKYFSFLAKFKWFCNLPGVYKSWEAT